MDDERACITDIGQMAEKVHIRDQFHTCFMATGDTKGEHRPCPFRQIFLTISSVNSESRLVLQNLDATVADIVMIVAPFTFMILVVGIVATILQTGFVFALEPLKPDIKRLSLVKGIKKFFSKRILFELFKTAIKFSVFSLIIYYEIKSSFSKFSLLLQQSPYEYVAFFIELGGSLLFKLIVALVIIAVVDYIFSRWEYLKNMMMTRKELKDEHKRRDGDPHIKSKRREIERELRKKSQSLDAVAGANIVITNPTHYAVAIKYDRLTMRAPAVVGKGADKLAIAIRRKAYLSNVPVISSPKLTRHLYKKVSIDSPIPESTYNVVARLLYKAHLMREKSQAGAA